MNETDLGMVCTWPGIRGSTEETDQDDSSDYEEEGAAKSLVVKIEGMQMLTQEQSGLKDKSEGNDQLEHALEMNNATAKLNPGKERLGCLVQLLARIYSHREQTTHPSQSMANSDPQKMVMVL